MRRGRTWIWRRGRPPARPCWSPDGSLVRDRCPIGLALDALTPGADRRVRREVEAAFVRDMRVGVQRDVRQRVLTRAEIFAIAQRLFEHIERRIAVLLFLHEFLAELLARLAELQPEAQRRDVRLEV